MSRDDKSNVQRIAAVLKGFDAVNTPRRSADILSQLDMSRSTGYGLLRAMTSGGWLERVDHGVLRLGPKARGLVFAGLGAPDLNDGKTLAASRRTPGNAPSTGPELEWEPSLVRTVDAAPYRRAPPYRIGFSNASTSNAWRRAMLQSLNYAEKIAQAQISELIVCDAQDDPALQLRQIDELVELGIDLLLISITSVTARSLSDRMGVFVAGGLRIFAVVRRSNAHAWRVPLPHDFFHCHNSILPSL